MKILALAFLSLLFLPGCALLGFDRNLETPAQKLGLAAVEIEAIATLATNLHGEGVITSAQALAAADILQSALDGVKAASERLASGDASATASALDGATRAVDLVLRIIATKQERPQS